MRRILLAVGVVLFAVSCSAKPETVKMLDETLGTLNRNKVIYSGTLEGPLKAEAELYQGARIANGGWLSLRIQGPAANPVLVLEPEPVP